MSNLDEAVIIERLTKTEERIKSNTLQIQELKNRIVEIEKITKMFYEMNTNIGYMLKEMKDMREDSKASNTELKQEMRSMRGDISAIEDKVEQVQMQPMKNDSKDLNKIKWFIFTSISSLLIGYLFNSFIG